MSGPTTAILIGDPTAILLGAAAIRAAAAVSEGYAQAAALRDGHQAGRAALQAEQDAAGLQGLQAMQQEADANETRYDHLLSLAERLGTAEALRTGRPVRPGDGDPAALAAYLRQMQIYVAGAESILLTEAARQAVQPDAMPEALAQAAAGPVHAARTVSQRLLARISHLGQPPGPIMALARELDAGAPGQRTDLLATELRRQIQAHIESIQQQHVRQATAVIVEQSLKELGYQVEEIGSTLFVEGGVTHFRRRDWGNYRVRMRVDAASQTLNFNVIRSVTADDNQPSVLDTIAEDRWCSEFPALLKALELRGVHLNVTRRLAAGELPVQLVDAARLPVFASEEESRPVSASLAREIR